MIKDIRLTPTHYWPYECAEAVDVFLTLEGDEAEKLCEYLHSMASLPGPMDNKIVFGCQTPSARMVYVHWHDGKAYIGTDIHIRDASRVRHF